MPNYRGNSYQYETSPRKIEPEYRKPQNPYSKKKSSALKKKPEKKVAPKRKLKAHVKTVLYIYLVLAIETH